MRLVPFYLSVPFVFLVSPANTPFFLPALLEFFVFRKVAENYVKCYRHSNVLYGSGSFRPITISAHDHFGP